MDLAAGDEKRLSQAVCVHGAVIENMPEIIHHLLSHVQGRVQTQLVPFLLGHIAFLADLKLVEPSLRRLVHRLCRKDKKDEEKVDILLMNSAAVVLVALLIQEYLQLLRQILAGLLRTLCSFSLHGQECVPLFHKKALLGIPNFSDPGLVTSTMPKVPGVQMVHGVSSDWLDYLLNRCCRSRQSRNLLDGRQLLGYELLLLFQLLFLLALLQ
mmetsp:Transcript_4797/g.11426  ORF Transcript_4797/g.11426 Transcript_4797/m.11426 type:complete len:212 (-) Transcript_4797:1093-1728(-)